jgi:hypothetical protein
LFVGGIVAQREKAAGFAGLMGVVKEIVHVEEQ